MKNKNGIRIVTKKNFKREKLTPPPYELEQIILWKIVDGARKEIVLGNFDPVIKTLKRNGWREVK